MYIWGGGQPCSKEKRKEKEKEGKEGKKEKKEKGKKKKPSDHITLPMTQPTATTAAQFHPSQRREHLEKPRQLSSCFFLSLSLSLSLCYIHNLTRHATMWASEGTVYPLGMTNCFAGIRVVTKLGAHSGHEALVFSSFYLPKSVAELNPCVLGELGGERLLVKLALSPPAGITVTLNHAAGPGKLKCRALLLGKNICKV